MIFCRHFRFLCVPQRQKIEGKSQLFPNKYSSPILCSVWLLIFSPLLLQLQKYCFYHLLLQEKYSVPSPHSYLTSFGNLSQGWWSALCWAMALSAQAIPRLPFLLQWPMLGGWGQEGRSDTQVGLEALCKLSSGTGALPWPVLWEEKEVNLQRPPNPAGVWG